MAQHELTAYRNLISVLKPKYSFAYFNAKHADSTILLRHDIRLQDIENGYKMIEIEKQLGVKATYFVQYNSPQESNNISYQERYIKFINYCIRNNVEVQPHVLPISGAFNQDSSLSKEVHDTEKVRTSYTLNRVADYDEFTMTDDFLEIEKLNKAIIKYLKEYNEAWNEKFGFYPKGISVHGDCTFPEIVGGLNTRTLMNQKCFGDIYEYIDRSHALSDRFSYISDTEYNIALFNPEKLSANAYQILIHPALWSGASLETNVLTSKFGFTLGDITRCGSASDKKYLSGGFEYEKKKENWGNELISKTGLLKLDKSLSICDSGCGDGFWSRILNEHFDKVFGEDISKGGIYMGIKNNIMDGTDIRYEYCDSLTNETRYDIMFTRHHGLLAKTQVSSPHFLFNFLRLASRGEINVHILLQKLAHRNESRDASEYEVLKKFFLDVEITDWQGNDILVLRNPIEENINAELEKLRAMSLMIKSHSVTDKLYFKHQSNMDILRLPGRLDFFIANSKVKSYVDCCKTLLDTGCGNGIVSGELSKYYTVTGEDISKVAITIARYSSANASYRCESSLDLHDKHDIVFAKGPSFLVRDKVNSTEFKRNLEHLINRARKILIFICHYRCKTFSLADKSQGYIQDPDEVNRLFRSYGEVLDCKYVQNYYFITIKADGTKPVDQVP